MRKAERGREETPSPAAAGGVPLAEAAGGHRLGICYHNPVLGLVSQVLAPGHVPRAFVRGTWTSRPLGTNLSLHLFPEEMSSKPARGRGVSTSRVRDDPAEMATPSSPSVESADSLLREVEEFPEGSTSGSQSDELILLEDGGAGGQAGQSEDHECEVASTSGLSGLATDVNPSKLRPRAALKAFNDAGIDPLHFYLIVPTPNDRAHRPPAGHMTVYTRALTFGETIPFHPFVKGLCAVHGISPAQLSPNCWVTINSMIILWRKFLRADLTVDEFLYCYSLKASPDQRGFFYLASTKSKPPVPPLVVEKTTSAHGWKPQFFFLGGDFNSHPLDGNYPLEAQSAFRKYCGLFVS